MNCNICTEVATIFAIGDCNHPICYKCSYKLLKFYNYNCYLCKSTIKTVYYTKSLENARQDYLKNTDILKDLDMYFENQEIFSQVSNLTSFKCRECFLQCKNLKELKKHLQIHKKSFCFVCLKDKKEFVNFLEIYDKQQLSAHLSDVHEECLFCQIKFYDKDLLFQHLKKEHENCFLCKRVGKDLYFQNYSEVEKHFSQVHFTCQELECLEKKFVVFDSEIDLKSHYLQQHSDKKLSKSFRKLQITFNHSDETTQPSHSTHSYDRSTHSANSYDRSNMRSNDPDDRSNVTNENGIRNKIPKEFGNKLTSENTVNNIESAENIGNTRNAGKEKEKDIIIQGIQEPQVLKKLSDLLSRDSEKYIQFISIYDAFKGDLVSGKEFLKIFIESSSGNIRDIEKVWKKLADLTPNYVKKNRILLSELGNTEMLKAWNDFKIKNSNQISHWDNVDSWANSAQLKTGNSGNLLVLSRSNIPSKPVVSQSNSTWANRPSSSTTNNLEDFPSLPTASRPSSSRGGGSSGSSDTVEWKKKGKKKVLLHFG